MDVKERVPSRATWNGYRSKIERFLIEHSPRTPFLVVDLDVVARKYRELTISLPEADIFYAVKANPSSEILELLVELGAHFDVASPAEIDLCLLAGATPDHMSFGNTIKKECDIAYAYRRGVRLFAFDSLGELEKLAATAPGSEVFCRILTDGGGADWPLSRKFGCEPEMAFDLLRRAKALGLVPVGVSFHVGSQQRDPSRWEIAIRTAADLYWRLEQVGIELRIINVGGGFPAHYQSEVPDMGAYASSIRRALKSCFASTPPSVIIEPGRFLVGDAGVLVSEVVLVAQKSYEEQRRWVYLDVGVFGGLAETLGEAIRYELRTSREGGPDGPVVLAGPTCDSMDIMYERAGYRLPLDLQAGDRVEILSAGAYTATYSTVGFNGFAPLATYCIA